MNRRIEAPQGVHPRSSVSPAKRIHLPAATQVISRSQWSRCSLGRPPHSGGVVTEGEDLADVLIRRRQKVFDPKTTNRNPRAERLSQLQAMNLSIEELQPTIEDVTKVFGELPSSAADLDGTPFSRRSRTSKGWQHRCSFMCARACLKRGRRRKISTWHV